MAAAVKQQAGPSADTPATPIATTTSTRGSMFHSRSHIQYGDIVIVCLGRTEFLALNITRDKFIHNKYGRYTHSDMVGLPFGTKMISPPPQSGYIYLLRPTPELWTMSLPHRTQILYNPDISYIIMRLGIRVGGKVLEAGTGSGSMTHSLSRAVGDSGYVGSYEYHHTRYLKAHNIRLQHRNVCKDGFGDVQNAEAVFLDLPAPWEAIPLVLANLRNDTITKICCFSPCIEQVHKTCTALRENGFEDVSTQEVLARTHEMPGAIAPGSKPLRDVTSIVEDLRSHEARKTERRVVQMRNARERTARIKAAQEGTPAAVGDDADAGSTGLNEDGAEGHAAHTGEKRKATAEASDSTKKARTDADAVTASAGGSGAGADRADALNDVEADDEDDDADGADVEDESQWTAPPEPESTIMSQILLRIQPEMRGHTSYLTFASLPPLVVREALAAQGKTGSGWNTPAAVGAKPATAAPPTATATASRPSAGAPSVAASASATEQDSATDYGDQALEQAMGTLTEEEMFALLSGP